MLEKFERSLQRVELKLEDMLKRLHQVNFLIMDFDGVLTDNMVTTDSDGVEYVTCSKSDSLGLTKLRSYDVKMLVVSKETNRAVSQRCLKLGIDYLIGVDNKMEAVKQYIAAHDIDYDKSKTVYIGNDINDLDCMVYMGMGVCPADAYPEVKKQAFIVLEHNGGNGAVRELCDLITEEKERCLQQSFQPEVVQ